MALEVRSPSKALPKRVPLVLPEVEEDDRYGLSQAVFEELDSKIKQESKNLKLLGIISPRRSAPPASGTGEKPKQQPAQESEDSTFVSKPLFPSPAIKNPHWPKKSSLTGASSGPESSGDTSTIPKHLPVGFPILRGFFTVLGQTALTAKQLPWLGLLHATVATTDSKCLWELESDLEKKIRLRRESAEAEEKERQLRQKELLNSQRQQRDPHAVFMAEYNRVTDEIRRGAERDQAVLHDLDDALERAEKRRAKEEEQKKEALSLLEQRRKEREERSAARKAEVQKLQDEEEEMRDQVLAATRIRHRFDQAKEKVLKGADVGTLDSY
jgi:DNA repair exonuclease SbcCD ATPase subunit